MSAVRRIRARVERRHGLMQAYAFTPGAAPAEIQLWNVGANATDYGVHYWTARSVAQVMATYETRGNPLQIDVEHGELPQSAGYAALSIRDGAPWLAFDWSAFALEQIETKQRRFLSPEYDVDVDTGEIINVVRVSLVADPGTHNARMLARSIRAATGGETHVDGDPMNLQLLLAALTAAANAPDPEQAQAQIQALIAQVQKIANGEDASDPNEPAETTPPATPAASAAAGAPPPAPPAPDPTKKKPPMAASSPATAAIAASAPAQTAMRVEAGADPVRVVAQLSTKVAELEATVAERTAKEERERIAARNAKLPESLRAFAPSDDQAFETFCAEPHVAGAIQAHAKAQRAGGVQASAAPTRGARADGGESTPETKRVLAEAFGRGAGAPEKSYRRLPGGGLEFTHMSRPSAARRA